MAGKYVTLDDALVEQIQHISTVIPVDKYASYLAFSVNVLEGISMDDEMKELASSLSMKPDTFKTYCHTAGAILWEFAKGNPADSSIVGITLQQLGLSEEVAEMFSMCYHNNKRNLAHIKGALDISHQRFEHMSWRLDMELARRNAQGMTEPKFQIRLDLRTPASSVTSATSSSIESVHLQSDYANLKRVQDELQLAVNEHSSTHCQRIARYIT
mmetsp:Transcript_6659/g.10918  ORF Transcript_6659/g.10918 Transcript_6659/m.10918 type:complete len:214 (+) Transcript_6659:94-735(+)